MDYIIHCVCNNKKDLAHTALTWGAGFDSDIADAFIEEVEKLHADDLSKVQLVQDALQMGNEDLLDMAHTILRVLG